MNSTVAKLGLLFAGSLVALAMGEVALRLYAAAIREAPSGNARPASGLMREDTLTEWYPRESITHERTATNGQTFQLRINSTGQRGNEIGARAPGELRLLFLGDSFTMAQNLPEEETFVGRTAGLLTQALPFPTRCINAGVNGYSTYQELASYRYHGRKVQPDVVVLCFFVGNDFRDNMVGTRQGRSLNPVLIPTLERFVSRHQEPFLRRGDAALRDPLSGDLVLRPQAPWLEMLERSSFLARLLGSRYASITGRWTGDIARLDRHSRYHFYELGLFQQRSDGLFATSVELTLEAVRQLHNMATEDGADLVTVLLPSQHQVDEARWRRTLTELGVEERALGNLDKRYPNRLMAAFCASRGIPLLDLHDAFAGAPDPSRLYTAAIDDLHFSAAGHALAATSMAAFLTQRLGPPFYEAAQAYRVAVRAMDRDGDHGAAEEGLREAVRRRPGWSAPHVALGELHLEAGALKRAARHFNEAITLYGDSWRAREGFAEVCVAGGDLETAIQAYLQALKLRPAWWPYRERLHQIHQQRGEVETAALHRRAVDREFAAPAAVRRFWWSEHDAQGTAFAARRKWREAERELVRAVAFLPDDPVSHYNLGNLYEHLSREDEAVASYRKALAVAPGFTPARDRLRRMRAE